MANLDKNNTGDRLQLLIDAVIDYAIYMLDPEGRVLSWNAGAVRMKGYSTEVAIGRHFSEFYTQEDRARGLPDKALAIARQAGRFHGEGWRVRKDGSRFWALVVVDPMKDEAGELIGFAKVTRDITERQQAQLSLLESERRYRRLVESVVDYAIFQLDPGGLVTTWNAGAERIKGYLPKRSSASTSASSTPARTRRRVFRPKQSRKPPRPVDTRPRGGGCAGTAAGSGPRS